jgi:hypothetical protein
MECRKIQEKLHAYLEGVVPAREENLIREHLSSCPDCKVVLEEIKKTAKLLKNLDRIEPPPWLSQRIMGRIREEAENHRGIADWLFRPLRVKVPLQAFALVLILGFAALVYRENATQYERARTAPTAAGTVPKDQTPAPRNEKIEELTSQNREGTAARDVRRKQKVPPSTTQGGPATVPSQEVEKKVADSVAEQPERAKGFVPPAPSTQGAERAQEQATTGAIHRDEGPAKSNALRLAAPSLGAKSEKAGPLTIALKSEDAEQTTSEIADFLGRIEARRVTMESRAGVWVVTAEVKKDDLPRLFEMLKRRGAPQTRPTPPEGVSASPEVPVRIEITSP